MSYIKREDVMAEIERIGGHNLCEWHTIGVKAMIDRMPTADVVEVKHGFWFISEYEYLNCSECGESYFTGADSTAEAKERLAEGRYYPYCPHCGAKMDAEPPKRKERKKRNV